MPGFKQFQQNLGRRGRQVEKGVEQVIRAVAREVDAAVVQSTPVDTGHARSNWIVQLNSAATEEISNVDQSGKVSSFERSGLGAISRGEQVIGRFNVQRDMSIHISNNVPYIEQLNAGSSTQAPAGFVQQAIANGVFIVRRSRLFT